MWANLLCAADRSEALLLRSYAQDLLSLVGVALIRTMGEIICATGLYIFNNHVNI